MEYSGVVFLEAIVVAHNTEEQFVILSEIGGGCKQPAITQLALLHIKARISLDEELRIIADLHGTQPFIAAIGTTRVEQTLVSGWKFRIFEERARVETLLTNVEKILHVLLAPQTARLFANLKLDTNDR